MSSTCERELNLTLVKKFKPSTESKEISSRTGARGGGAPDRPGSRDTSDGRSQDRCRRTLPGAPAGPLSGGAVLPGSLRFASGSVERVVRQKRRHPRRRVAGAGAEEWRTLQPAGSDLDATHAAVAWGYGVRRRDGRGDVLGGRRAFSDRRIVGALHERGRFLHRVWCFVGHVPVAVPRRSGVFELSVGHTPTRGRFRVHMAEPEAEAHQQRSSAPRRAVVAALHLLQADAHVGRRQDPERVSNLARSHRAGLSLRHATVADAARVVGVDARPARGETLRRRGDARD